MTVRVCPCQPPTSSPKSWELDIPGDLINLLVKASELNGLISTIVLAYVLILANRSSVVGTCLGLVCRVRRQVAERYPSTSQRAMLQAWTSSP